MAAKCLKYEALQTRFSTLVKAIKPSVCEVATKLFEKNLITLENLNRAHNKMIDKETRTIELLTQVLQKIEEKEAHFDTFVSILEQISTLKDLGHEMKRSVYGSEIQDHRDFPPQLSPIHSHVSPHGLHLNRKPPLPSILFTSSRSLDSESVSEADPKSYSTDHIPLQSMSLITSRETRSVPGHDSETNDYRYLDTTNLSKAGETELTQRLKNDTENIVATFRKLVLRTFESLSQRYSAQKVGSAIVILWFKPVCLSENDKKELKSGDFNQIQECLIEKKHISFFNFKLLEHLVDSYGNDEDKKGMDHYKFTTFSDFCRRSVFEVPSHVIENLSPPTQDTKFVVKVSNKYFSRTGKSKKQKRFTMKELDDVQREIRDIFCSPFVFACGVREGCVEITFAVMEGAPIVFLTETLVKDLFEAGYKVINGLDFQQGTSVTPELESKYKRLAVTAGDGIRSTTTKYQAFCRQFDSLVTKIKPVLGAVARESFKRKLISSESFKVSKILMFPASYRTLTVLKDMLEKIEEDEANYDVFVSILEEIQQSQQVPHKSQISLELDFNTVSEINRSRELPETIAATQVDKNYEEKTGLNYLSTKESIKRSRPAMYTAIGGPGTAETVDNVTGNLVQREILVHSITSDTHTAEESDTKLHNDFSLHQSDAEIELTPLLPEKTCESERENSNLGRYEKGSDSGIGFNKKTTTPKRPTTKGNSDRHDSDSKSNAVAAILGAKWQVAKYGAITQIEKESLRVNLDRHESDTVAPVNGARTQRRVNNYYDVIETTSRASSRTYLKYLSCKCKPNQDLCCALTILGVLISLPVGGGAGAGVGAAFGGTLAIVLGIVIGLIIGTVVGIIIVFFIIETIIIKVIFQGTLELEDRERTSGLKGKSRKENLESELTREMEDSEDKREETLDLMIKDREEISEPLLLPQIQTRLVAGQPSRQTKTTFNRILQWYKQSLLLCKRKTTFWVIVPGIVCFLVGGIAGASVGAAIGGSFASILSCIVGLILGAIIGILISLNLAAIVFRDRKENLESELTREMEDSEDTLELKREETLDLMIKDREEISELGRQTKITFNRILQRYNTLWVIVPGIVCFLVGGIAGASVGAAIGGSFAIILCSLIGLILGAIVGILLSSNLAPFISEDKDRKENLMSELEREIIMEDSEDTLELEREDDREEKIKIERELLMENREKTNIAGYTELT